MDHQIIRNNWNGLTKLLMDPVMEVSKKYFEMIFLKSDTFEKCIEKNMHNIFHLYVSKPCCKCTKDIPFKHKGSINEQILQLFVRRDGDNKCQRLNPTCICAYRVIPSLSLQSVDITLLYKIIKTIDNGNLHIGIISKYKEIRDTRNYLFHQGDDKSVSKENFEKFCKILTDSHEYILKFIDDEEFSKHTCENINEILRTTYNWSAQNQIGQDSRIHCIAIQEVCTYFIAFPITNHYK